MACNDEQPLDVLEGLVTKAASGEFIAVSDDVEVHVYLLRGRIAWATSSTCPNRFTRYLVEQCGVASDTLKEVVAECQRRRSRVGEMLVEWNLASREQVRDALCTQIVGTLSSLLAIASSARALFLHRTMTYAADLTFDLSEIWSLVEPESAPQREGRQAEEIALLLPDALLTCTTHDAVLTSAHPASDDSSREVVERLAGNLLVERADVMVVRSAYGTLIGQAAPAQAQSFWCALPPHGNLGIARAVLGSLGRSPAQPDSKPLPRAWSALPNPGLLSSLAPLERAIQATDELVAAAVIAEEGVRFASVQREGFETSRLVSLAVRLGGILQISLEGVIAARDLHALYDRPSLQLGADRLDYFAEIVRIEPSVSLWLAFSRSTPQGLCWALLATLIRQVADFVRPDAADSTGFAEESAGLAVASARRGGSE